MKGVPTRLRQQGAAASLIATFIVGTALVAGSAQAPAPALAADAPLPPSTAAFSPAGLNLTGRVVAGEVRAAGANALPIGSRLILSREDAWDFSVIDLPADGRFDLPNVPGERVDLRVGMQGFRPAGKSPALGRLESDRTGLLLLMEPGN